MSKRFKWYNINPILSYKALVSVVIGIRGGGKTYGFKKKCIIDFLEKGYQFIWVRRYDTELTEVKKTFFSAITNDKDLAKYKDLQLEVKGNNVLINDMVAGTFLPLSLASRYKSSDFPNVKWIIFDEFIIENSRTPYISNEYLVLYGLIETVQRMRDDLRVVLIGNSIKFSNPYFIHWRIKPFNSEFLHIKDRSLVIQFYDNDEFAEVKSESRLGRLTKGTEYFDMAVLNKFSDMDEKFIQKKTDKAVYRCTVRYEGNEFGFWLDFDEGIMYVNRNVDHSVVFKYTLSQQDHDVNYFLVKNWRNTHFKEIVECYQMGILRFSDITVRNTIQEMMLYFI